jgi:hypothetical protein
MILFTVTFGFALASLNIGAVFAAAFQRRDPESQPGCLATIYNACYPWTVLPAALNFHLAQWPG